MPELSNDDALWAYSIRASQQVLNLDEERVQDPTLVRLLDIGVHDWHGSEEHLYSMTGKDNLRNHCVRALRHSALVGSRLLPRLLDLEDKVSNRFGNCFRVSLICRY
jgi:hypothetical protein